VAKQDKDLAGTGTDAPADGDDQGRRESSGDTGPQLAVNDAPAAQGTGETSSGGTARPAGFADGYLPSGQPDSAGPAGAGLSSAGLSSAGLSSAGSGWPSAGPPDSGEQSSPYASYGGYDPYPAPGQEPGYGGYGQPMGYGEERGYGQEPGYAAPEGYPPGYSSPDRAPGQDSGYPSPSPYGQGPSYGDSYGSGYGSGPAYPDGPSYAAPPASEAPSYSRDSGYSPAPSYAASADTGPQAPSQPSGGDDQPEARATPPGRDPASGPYPGQDPYQWQGTPPPYDAAPGQPAPGPYTPRRARPDGEGPAGRPYAPPRPTPDTRPPAEGEMLSPLPAYGGDQQQSAPSADDLSTEALLHGRRQAPEAGWRRFVFRTTGGMIHPRESADAVRRRDLIARVRTPVAGGHHRVAVMSLKGGVGKTTTCVSLGAMLASLRGDRIIALDANPDRGTLSDKVRLETAATVRDLLNERNQIHRYADVRAFTSQAPSRLEILASDRDPAVSIAFSEEDYYEAARVLEHFYSISLTDCGTGLLHSAMSGVLRMADQIVLVSSPSVDGARSASATLDWLEAHEYSDLVRNAVVVLSMIRPRSKSTVDLDRLENHFAGRCRSVARIPYDPHLEEGAEVDLEQMSPATVNAYLVLAATVGDGFAWPRRSTAPRPDHPRRPAPPPAASAERYR